MLVNMSEVIDEANLCVGTRTLLEKFLVRLIEVSELDEDTTISVKVLGEDEMRDLSNTWRGVDETTDVLAFPASGDDFPEPIPILGDIAVCWPVVLDNAAAAGHPPEYELFTVVTHGFLHLLGWDHPDDESLESMQNRTEELLEQCGIEVVRGG